jgi:hypothetical protein
MVSTTTGNSLRSEGGEHEKGIGDSLVINYTQRAGFGVIDIGQESDNSGLNPKACAKNLVKVNIYPESGVVAIGVNLSRCGTHFLVHLDTKDYLERNKSSLSETHIRAFRNGSDIIISLAPLSVETMEQIGSSDLSKKESARQKISDYLTRYQKAIEMATKVAELEQGKVILDFDYSGAQDQDVAKMLGRLYQVDTAHAKSGKAGVDKNIEYLHESAVPYLYDRTKGSRYFFLEDLERIAGLITNTEKSQSDVEEALSELNRYFAGRNINKVREGLIFLFDSSSKCLDLRDQTHDEIAQTIADTCSSVENTDQESWPDERARISGELTNAIEILKKKYPKFHSLNSDDSDLVKVISRVLRHGEIGIELGRQFSTRVEPKPLGRFVIEGDNKTFQFDHEADSTLRSVTKWLLTESTRESLKQIRPDFDIEKADWIQVYEGEPLHRESESRRMGAVAYRSLVFEIGELGKPPLWLVVEVCPHQISDWQLDLREAKYKLSSAILRSISPAGVITLAPDFIYHQISDETNSSSEISIRFREFRPEIRADKLSKKDLSQDTLSKAVSGWAQWHAFLLLSGGFKLPNRTIVVDPDNGNLKSLSVGPSFLSMAGQKGEALLNEIVPRLLGNSLAQFVGCFTYLSKDPVSNIDELVSAYQRSLAQALKAIVKTKLPRTLEHDFDKVKVNFPQDLNGSLKPSLKWLKTIIEKVKKENEFPNKFAQTVGRYVKHEVRQIKKIVIKDGAFNLQEATFCAETIQAFIEQHPPGTKTHRKALKTLEQLPEKLPNMTVFQQGAFVCIVDLKRRIKRADSTGTKVIAKAVAQYFRKKINDVEDEHQYAKLIRGDQQNWPLNTPDLSPEELRRVYLSFKQLEGVFSESSGNKQLNKAKRILGFWSPKP